MSGSHYAIIRYVVNDLTILEEHHFLRQCKSCIETRVLAVSSDKSKARDVLARAFENRWSEHVFPEELWLSECYPPEESPDAAWFSSKFPEEGMYRFCIKER